MSISGNIVCGNIVYDTDAPSKLVITVDAVPSKCDEQKRSLFQHIVNIPAGAGRLSNLQVRKHPVAFRGLASVRVMAELLPTDVTPYNTATADALNDHLPIDLIAYCQNYGQPTTECILEAIQVYLDNVV